MRCAVMTLAVLAAIATGYADDESKEETRDPAVGATEAEYTKEQLADAKRVREQTLEEIRRMVAVHQNRLSGSRSAVDSRERQKLKAALSGSKAEFAKALKEPLSHWIEMAEIEKQAAAEEAVRTMEEAKVARERAAANAKRAEELIEKNGPLDFEAGGLHPNAINIPALTLVLRNRSSKSVVAYTIAVECKDRFDNPAVEIKKDNIYRGISQTTVPAGAKDKGTWTLNLHRNATKLRVWVTRARFADGTEWSQTDADAFARGNFARIEMD